MNSDPLYGAILQNQPSLLKFRAKNYTNYRIYDFVLAPDIVMTGQPYRFCVYEKITLEIAVAITLEDPWKILDLCAKMANPYFLIDLLNEMENCKVWELYNG
jgi:hypothetical protein